MLRWPVLGTILGPLLWAAALASAGEPSLTLSPASGPVGTRVVISGPSACDPYGRGAVTLTMLNAPGADHEGGTGLGRAPIAGGRFSLAVTIPDELGPVQGRGGGPTTPGEYVIQTNPPSCHARFTVTGSAAASPATAAPSASATPPITVAEDDDSGVPIVALTGAGVVGAGAAAAGWLLARRRRPTKA